MSTYNWSIPEGKEILGSTKIKDADNKLKDTIDDLADFVNGVGVHANQGLTFDLIDRTTSQIITGTKTFNNGLNGNLTGNVTGDLTGNADTATSLETSRSISLTGDVSGSATFDGTSNVSISATVADDSHSHIIGNVDGLQSALDSKQNSSTAVTTSDVNLSAWTIVESSGILYFKYNNVNKAKLDSSGNLTVTGNVTAYGSV